MLLLLSLLLPLLFLSPYEPSWTFFPTMVLQSGLSFPLGVRTKGVPKSGWRERAETWEKTSRMFRVTEIIKRVLEVFQVKHTQKIDD